MPITWKVHKRAQKTSTPSRQRNMVSIILATNFTPASTSATRWFAKSSSPMPPFPAASWLKNFPIRTTPTAMSMLTAVTERRTRGDADSSRVAHENSAQRQRQPTDSLNHMKKIVVVLLFLYSNLAGACDMGLTSELTKFWREFRSVSLKGNPVDISKFYHFPLIMAGPYHGDKPIRLLHGEFLNNYDQIFKSGFVGNEKNALYADLEKMDELRLKKALAQYLDATGCVRKNMEVRIGNYLLTSKDQARWQVTSVYYFEEFDVLKAFLDRK